MDASSCFHCGLDIDKKAEILFDEKLFCCAGCKTVYELFRENDLGCYYDFEQSPGTTPLDIKGKYDFLTMMRLVPNYWSFKKPTPRLFHFTFLIFIAVRAFGFWKIYSVFSKE
jgi:Cu+-exporting ATPase